MSTLVRFPEFDHYVFSRVLGEGGMGIVFLAEDRRTGLPVAIKVMSRSLQDPELQARFMKETQILASLNHRNIVRCYEIVRAKEGLPSIVMEFLEGVDFSALEGRPFPELTPLMVQAAMGLNYLKERTILHRDLSSNNILVTIVNGRRLVKIVDFGVAKVLQEGAGSELTQTGEFLGKLAYASPELLMLSPADFRSDIYSLGVIFFRLLTTRRPLQVTNSRSYLEWVRAHEQRVPLDFTVPAGNPALPALLTSLVGKMLQRDPADRPQTYEEIIDTLVSVQSQAEKDGLAPDPAALATLPVRGGEGLAVASGAPGSGAAASGAAGAGAPFAPSSASGGSGASSSSSGDSPTSAQTSAFMGGEPPPATGQPDWLASSDRLEELAQVASAERNRWERPSGEVRSRTDAAARRRAETLRQAKETQDARHRRRNAFLGAGFATLGLVVGGYFAWDSVLRDEFARLRAGAPIEATPAPAPVETHAPPAARAGASLSPARPAQRPTAAPPAAPASAEGRGLVTSNVAGFLPNPVASSGAKGAILLVGFRRPANVTGLKQVQIVEARDSDGRPIAGLEGSEAVVLPADDPTGAGRIRIQLADTIPHGDPRVAALAVVEIDLGPARFRAKLDKGVLSN